MKKACEGLSAIGALWRMIGDRRLAKDDWGGMFSEGDNQKDRLSKDRCR